MNSSANGVPAGLEVASTLQILQLSSGTGAGLSSSSTTTFVVFLSVFGLATLVAIYWTRRWSTPKVLDGRLPENEIALHDIEALAAPHRDPVFPATPRPPADVRWTPQIRSISGPALSKGSDRTSAAQPPKRARSPPPSIKTQTQFLDSYAKSAPAHTLLFPQSDALHLPKSSRGDESPPVTPHALAVSGMQTRSLGGMGAGG